MLCCSELVMSYVYEKRKFLVRSMKLKRPWYRSSDISDAENPICIVCFVRLMRELSIEVDDMTVSSEVD